ARAAFESGAWVLLGRCDEDLRLPHGPFVEAVTHLVTHAPLELLADHVRSCGGELARFTPLLRTRLSQTPDPQSTDPDTERYLLYGALIDLVARASADRPVVLVLDDLQWADRPSLQLLRHLISCGTTMQVLVIGTYRDSELTSSHPLVETLVA